MGKVHNGIFCRICTDEAKRCCADVASRGTTKASTEPHCCVHSLFVRNSPSLAQTTHTFICYLCTICVVKANSTRRRSMYAQVAGSGRREDANIRWDSADGPLCICNSWLNLLPERRARLLYLLFVVISNTLEGKRRPNWMEGARPETI